MHNIKFTTRLVLVKGIFIILLGLAHNILLWVLQERLFQFPIPEDVKTEFYCWFALAGFFFVFIGTIETLCFRQLKNRRHFAWIIALVCSITSLIVSLTGIIILQIGPPVVIFVFALPTIFLLIKNRSSFNFE